MNFTDDSKFQYSPREVTQLIADETGQVTSVKSKTIQPPDTPEGKRIIELEETLCLARFAIIVTPETLPILSKIDSVLNRTCD